MAGGLGQWGCGALLVVLVTPSLAIPRKIIWDIDRSVQIATPATVIRGNRGQDCPESRPSCSGQNGNGTNIYGNRGIMPHFQGSTPINGGIPQRGNLTQHLVKFKADFASLVPDPAYKGYCLLDFEFFRADWNSTTDQMRNESIAAAHGNSLLAKEQYEAGAKSFLLSTINAARELRPGCKLGMYGYPRNNLPSAATDSPAYKEYCKAHPFDCSFAGYGNNSAGDAQRKINDNLAWLWNASDAIFPSVYLGKLPSQQNNHTAAESIGYINQTVTEARRLASEHGNKEVMPVTWYFYDNYPRTPSWHFLTKSDLQIEIGEALSAGASGVLLWGAVDNSSVTIEQLQEYVNATLTPVLANLCQQFKCE